MMKKTPDTKLDLELDTFFEAAKAANHDPNGSFLETIAADALYQTELRAKTRPKPQAPAVSLSGLLRSLGGWQTAAAMTACATVGIFAGYYAPDSLDYLNNTQTTAETFTDDSFSIASDIEALFLEG